MDFSLNEVPIGVVKDQLGIDGWDAIEQLTAFLFSEQLPPRKSDALWVGRIPRFARVAPSVVSRIEVSVFGTSTPRFCYRLYFDGVASFVNVRRLKLLCEAIRSEAEIWRGHRNPNLTQAEKHPRIIAEIEEDITSLLTDTETSSASAIADCLLQTPERYHASEYHVIKAGLFKEHGEALEWAGQTPEYRGTPYVKTVIFGGGLCAQACCFVSTALLYRHAYRIHGLGEITSLALSAELKELLIAGLTETEMSRYFSFVGLRSIAQFTNPYINAKTLKRNQDSDFGQALHGYVASGMPVILLVDIGRMNGDGVEGVSIYETNCCHSSAAQYRDHAVTVVGSCRWVNAAGHFRTPAASNSVFLFVDSAAFPFMQASVEQLAQIGTWEVNDEPRPLAFHHPTLMPVTPEPVKMPLLCWRKPGNSKEFGYGLVEMSKRYDRFQIDPLNREFVLAPLNKMYLSIFRAVRHFNKNYYNDVVTILCETIMSEFAKRLNWAQDHWVWLECGEGKIKVWDAESEPADNLGPAAWLKAVIQLENGKPAARFITTSGEDVVFPSLRSAPFIPEQVDSKGSTQNIGSHPLRSPQSGRLHACLISSFSALGMRRAVEFWKKAAPFTRFVEAYTCMQDDLPDFFGAKQGSRAVAVLAEKANQPGADQEFANALRKLFSGTEIVAFATFMPEIMARNYCEAQEALKFLIRTARYLKVGERPFTIELVGGSRLQGIWNAKTTELEPALAVNRIDVQTAVPILLERLEQVAECANESPGIQLALEIEPGPSFVLDPFAGGVTESADLLLDLCNHIAKSSNPAVRQALGVNLDIAHWALLSNVHLDWLNQPRNSVIRERIVHAHISDHGKGHFCDNAIGTCHKLEAFHGWIEFLATLAARDPDHGCPRYSGFVSCEMEACKSASFVRASLEGLEKLL